MEAGAASSRARSYCLAATLRHLFRYLTVLATQLPVSLGQCFSLVG